MKKDWGMQMLSLPLQASLTVGGLTVVFGGRGNDGHLRGKLLATSNDEHLLLDDTMFRM
jgi:hypothetical protein